MLEIRKLYVGEDMTERMADIGHPYPKTTKKKKKKQKHTLRTLSAYTVFLGPHEWYGPLPGFMR